MLGNDLLAERRLSNAHVEHGQKLISALQRDGVAIQAAFWARRIDGEWRLNLVMPDVVKSGPRAALNLVIRKLDALDGSVPLDVLSIDPKSPQDFEVIDLIHSNHLEIATHHSLVDVGPPERRIEGLYSYFAHFDQMLEPTRIIEEATPSG